jgi:hypothetical protein
MLSAAKQTAEDRRKRGIPRALHPSVLLRHKTHRIIPPRLNSVAMKQGENILNHLFTACFLSGTIG